MPTFSRRRERGFGLFEALIALLVLCAGVYAALRLDPELRRQADLARQRSEALRLAQEDLERQRGYAALTATPGLSAYADIVPARREIDGPGANTVYVLERQVDADATPGARQVGITVTWADRSGAAQELRLASLIAGIDPALAGSLGLAHRGIGVRGAAGRSASIPLAAHNLGDGRSVFKPVEGGLVAIVFDNRSGAVVATCTVPGDRTTANLDPADLSGCTSLHGMLLSGEIRFSTTSPPDAAGADTLLPLAVALDLEGTPLIAPWCRAEAKKTVTFVRAGSERIEAVPVDATPASFGLTAWTDIGEHHVAYHCVIVPPAGITRWSGRTSLVPAGWSIGTGPADWRVCRRARDLDASGAVDANIEHPAIYQNVTGALKNQNFLVVRGNESCPAGSTEPHQP
jgi:Tfp pilus assembly protein PilV